MMLVSVDILVSGEKVGHPHALALRLGCTRIYKGSLACACLSGQQNTIAHAWFSLIPVALTMARSMACWSSRALTNFPPPDRWCLTDQGRAL